MCSFATGPEPDSLASFGADGATGNGASSAPTLSSVGGIVAYTSVATNLVRVDTQRSGGRLSITMLAAATVGQDGPRRVAGRSATVVHPGGVNRQSQRPWHLVVTDTVPARRRTGGIDVGEPRDAALDSRPATPGAGNVMTWTIPGLSGLLGYPDAVTLTFGVSVNLPIANGTAIYNTALAGWRGQLRHDDRSQRPGARP